MIECCDSLFNDYDKIPIKCIMWLTWGLSVDTWDLWFDQLIIQTIV